MSSQYVSYSQFAEILGCTRQLISRMVLEGSLPTIAVGKRKRIDLGRFNQIRMDTPNDVQLKVEDHSNVR